MPPSQACALWRIPRRGIPTSEIRCPGSCYCALFASGPILRRSARAIALSQREPSSAKKPCLKRGHLLRRWWNKRGLSMMGHSAPMRRFCDHLEVCRPRTCPQDTRIKRYVDNILDALGGWRAERGCDLRRPCLCGHRRGRESDITCLGLTFRLRDRSPKE